MARRKKPEDETNIQLRQRHMFETIANSSDRGDKTSWNRKMDNMVKLLAKLRPIEEEIMALHARKMPIFDEVQLLREAMVKECVHPYQHLVEHANHVVCKFCNKRMRIPNDDTEQAQA